MIEIIESTKSRVVMGFGHNIKTVYHNSKLVVLVVSGNVYMASDHGSKAAELTQKWGLRALGLSKAIVTYGSLWELAKDFEALVQVKQ